MFIFMNLGVSFLSKRLNERLIVTTVQPIWHLIFLIVIIALPDDVNRWAKWVVTSLLMAYPVSDFCAYKIYQTNSVCVVLSSHFGLYEQYGKSTCSAYKAILMMP